MVGKIAMFVSPGYGDDQHDLGPDFVIDSWLDQFWGLALQLYPLQPGLTPIRLINKMRIDHKEWII